MREGAMHDQLSGLGLSCATDEIATQCARKLAVNPAPWQHLDYLSIGVYSTDVITPEMVAALRDARLAPAMHLLELNLVRPLREQQEIATAIYRRAEALGAVCVEEDMGFWMWGKTRLEQHMLPAMLDERTADIIIANLIELRRSVGVPVYAENPPIYCDLGDLDLLTFMERVAEGSGCGLVFDIGHFLGYCLISDREPEDYLRGWQGIRHVRELHVAGSTMRPDSAGPVWFDDHAAAISDYSFDILALAQAQASRRIPITLEQEGATIARVSDHITRATRRFFA
jgi:uncharacterized protein (UPF0276 family)